MNKDVILKSVSENLKELLEKKSAALPRNFNQTRWLQNCLTVLADTKDIEKCEPRSIARTMLKGAFLGLDFFNKECYAIPYGDRLQFQTDYKGEVKLCKLYSINPIKDIYAKLVKEGDVFEENIKDGKQSVNFQPKSFNDNPIIGAFAVVYYDDGSMMYETMSIKDIEETRQNYSKMPEGKAWKNSFGEMCRKTILRRLCKGIELNFDSAEQDKAFQEGGDLKDTLDIIPEKAQIADPFNAATKPQVERLARDSVGIGVEPESSTGEENTGQSDHPSGGMSDEEKQKIWEES